MMFAVSIGFSTPILANGYGETLPWQFRTSADKANLAAVQALIEQKKAGMFRSPVYNTTNTTHIDRQINCNVSATAYGNWASNGQTANSPSTTGASSVATGNSSSSDVSQGQGAGAINTSDNQTNSGTISAGVQGGTSVSNGGPSDQALNNSQTNSGTQSADVSNSTACNGVLQ